MKWTRASERLPEDKKVEYGTLLCNGFYFCKCEDDTMDVCLFKSGWSKFKIVTVGCECQEYKEEDVEVIEWLDESPESSVWEKDEWLEKDDGWIKIEDKKGLNLGSEYLIYMPDVKRVCSAFWMGANDWRLFDDYIVSDKITHWRELPNTPKS